MGDEDQFIVFVALYLLHSKQHVQVLIWVLAGSVAFYGIKGGLFTLREGGKYRVYDPPGSFIEDNNTPARIIIRLLRRIPLLRILGHVATAGTYLVAVKSAASGGKQF